MPDDQFLIFVCPHSWCEISLSIRSLASQTAILIILYRAVMRFGSTDQQTVLANALHMDFPHAGMMNPAYCHFD